MHLADDTATCDKEIAQHDNEIHATPSDVMHNQNESHSNNTMKDTAPIDAEKSASDTNKNSESKAITKKDEKATDSHKKEK